MDPLHLFQKLTIRLIFVDFFAILYMWTYAYFLHQTDPEDSSIEIPIWFLIIMAFNLLVATISRSTPGRRRKSCTFQALEVSHYFVLFLRLCAVPAFYEDYYEISLISITSLVAQCVIALYTGNEFVQDPPSRSNSSLHLNFDNSIWEVEKEDEEEKGKDQPTDQQKT